MPRHAFRPSRPFILFAALLVPIVAPGGLEAAGPFEEGDRVAWIGSSSTRIGVWPKTVEFLLRTRHPALNLSFAKHTTGGGTFVTGLEHYDEWLAASRPDVVVFNYGGNDAKAGLEGLPAFLETMGRSVARVRTEGARVLLVTPQAADVRKAGLSPAADRTLYAETMLGVGRARGWTVIDVHHPLEALQLAGQADDPDFTILKDKIHLTDPAYIAWGSYFFDRLDLPLARSAATLNADGTVEAVERCRIDEVEARSAGLAFTRHDEILPILPPGPLPSRRLVPLEAQSRYLLTVKGLEPGEYAIRCEGRPIGTASAEALDAGVNLNTILLDQGNKAPWVDLATSLWDGERLDQIGSTHWRFEVRKD